MWRSRAGQLVHAAPGYVLAADTLDQIVRGLGSSLRVVAGSPETFAGMPARRVSSIGRTYLYGSEGMLLLGGDRLYEFHISGPPDSLADLDRFVGTLAISG